MITNVKIVWGVAEISGKYTTAVLKTDIARSSKRSVYSVWFQMREIPLAFLMALYTLR